MIIEKTFKRKDYEVTRKIDGIYYSENWKYSNGETDFQIWELEEIEPDGIDCKLCFVKEFTGRCKCPSIEDLCKKERGRGRRFFDNTYHETTDFFGVTVDTDFAGVSMISTWTSSLNKVDFFFHLPINDFKPTIGKIVDQKTKHDNSPWAFYHVCVELKGSDQ
tara:strand:+ start:484 stop:972 length:489 start_codon:yes stop_codon:yes gene_type:complete